MKNKGRRSDDLSFCEWRAESNAYKRLEKKLLLWQVIIGLCEMTCIEHGTRMYKFGSLARNKVNIKCTQIAVATAMNYL
jgi:hypothetical protein